MNVIPSPKKILALLCKSSCSSKDYLHFRSDNEKNDVIAHFGGVTKTAKALGIKSQTVSQWSEDIPELRGS
ncbi:Cro/CI family transcriptional regulator [Arsukibacterium perlucidum]|uniref:Cro/CI family transcriptional regulator n=1 Tax=Arsukibacterium perlucidum TaxID=368811 RepID=UPI001969B38F